MFKWNARKLVLPAVASLGLLGAALAIRPRISELRAAGLIEDTGHRRKNKSGMSACIWQATDAGLSAVQQRGAA